MSFESLFVFILFKFKKRPNISRIQFVHERALLSMSVPRKRIKVPLPAEAALQWIERCCTTPITINSCGLSVVFWLSSDLIDVRKHAYGVFKRGWRQRFGFIGLLWVLMTEPSQSARLTQCFMKLKLHKHYQSLAVILWNHSLTSHYWSDKLTRSKLNQAHGSVFYIW